MIYISSALSQNEIIAMLEGHTGASTYKFLEKKGIKLSFETDNTDLDAAAAEAKALIKATEIGKVLFFQVSHD